MEPLPRVHWRKCQHKESNWETSLFILKAHMTATLLLLSYAVHLHTCKNIFRGIVNTDKYETNIKTRKNHKPLTLLLICLLVPFECVCTKERVWAA